MPDDKPETEYVSFRTKIQRGDGVDQRGDATVEVVRLREDEELGAEEAGELFDPNELELLGIPPDTPIPKHNEAFAEFYFELTRATDALERKLGLPGKTNDG